MFGYCWKNHRRKSIGILHPKFNGRSFCIYWSGRCQWSALFRDSHIEWGHYHSWRYWNFYSSNLPILALFGPRWFECGGRRQRWCQNHEVPADVHLPFQQHGSTRQCCYLAKYFEINFCVYWFDQDSSPTFWFWSTKQLDLCSYSYRFPRFIRHTNNHNQDWRCKRTARVSRSIQSGHCFTASWCQCLQNVYVERTFRCWFCLGNCDCIRPRHNDNVVLFAWKCCWEREQSYRQQSYLYFGTIGVAARQW